MNRGRSGISGLVGALSRIAGGGLGDFGLSTSGISSVEFSRMGARNRLCELELDTDSLLCIEADADAVTNPGVLETDEVDGRESMTVAS